MQSRTQEPKLVQMLIYPNAQSLDITGPLEVFDIANEQLPPGTVGYEIELIAQETGPIRMSSGIRICADKSLDELTRHAHTLMIAGGDGTRQMVYEQSVLAWLTEAATKVERIASVCSGTFLLAQAGLLDGKKATTHWQVSELLDQLYPSVTVVADSIYHRDGNVYTSAGITAGMDLALALVEEDFGRDVAMKVAKQLVLFLKRPGGQSQFSNQLAMQFQLSGPLESLAEWLLDNIEQPVSVTDMAQQVAMSPRNFARVFQRETGTTPAKFVEGLRVERAQQLLEASNLGLEQVAERCGFGSAERMRRSFVKTLNVLPIDYKRRFGSQAMANM